MPVPQTPMVPMTPAPTEGISLENSLLSYFLFRDQQSVHPEHVAQVQGRRYVCC